MAILPSQRVEIFDLIAASPLPVEDFDIMDTSAGTTRVFTSRSPFYYYAITEKPNELGPSSFMAEYSPGDQQVTERVGPGWWYQTVSPSITGWLRYLDRELSTPDPWAELRADRQLRDATASTVGVENTPFTVEEQAAIKAQLRELVEFIRAGGVDAAQMVSIEARINYVEGAASRLGRVDWQTVFAGVMFTLFAEAAAPSQLLREGMTLALRGLAHLFGVHVPELPPG